ncbi:hypothetical protein CPB83DRAFT_904546 [Crepidotus variabilis]|uniref:Uncharacterized protein n=1 Tax=Crepidotus variabilis TaxID=179855 RepID=A0A9P6EM76_9AGAR|nr:hypothetical protein CPB83DRAFT_904546 [Crepidotus variabilis]
MLNSAATFSGTYVNDETKDLLIGALIAMIAYGVALLLIGAYLHNLIQLEALAQASRDRINSASEKRSRYFFVSYTIVMFCLSTLSCIAGTLRAYNAAFPPSERVKLTQNAFSLFGDAIGVVLTSWCADALMFWRCLMMYKKASSIWRALLVALLSTLYAISIATGIAFIINCLHLDGSFMVYFAVASTVLNATIMVLIVTRIWCQQKFIESALGRGFTATYTRLIHLFVDSAALIVIFNLGHVILSQWSYRKYIVAHALLTHVYVISTLLIIYRIAGSLRRGSPRSATVVLDTELQLTTSFNSGTDASSLFNNEALNIPKADPFENLTTNLHSLHS